MLRALFWLLGRLKPIPAAYLAAWLVGAPWIAPDLVRICKRESVGHDCARPHGVHARDAWVSGREWRSQVRLGHLRPWCQPYREGQWGPRGNLGLSAASHWPFLPACYPPWVLDVPLVTMLVGAQKYLRVCMLVRKSRWCPGRPSFAFTLPN